MTSEGQRWALGQLEEIADASKGSLEIVDVREPAAEADSMQVEVSIDCSGYPREDRGIPFRGRERLTLYIPAYFPLDRPDVQFGHDRYGHFPHVQWGKQLCLYQSTDSEWQPDDGMFGYMSRLDIWLRHAARGEFDPLGFPLHPPVAYRGVGNVLMVIPSVNAPEVTPPWWVGYVEITAETEVRAELGRWFHYQDKVPEGRLAVAILLPSDMPFEYPRTIKELESTLAARNVPPDILEVALSLAALHNPKGKPLYFVLGAAMRGVSGKAERQQHLACWCIKSEQSWQLYTAALKAQEEQGQIAAAEFAQWKETADVNWCSVREERPEIVTPRDHGSALSWWHGRSVTLLGCGAIGSVIAMMLARAGIAKLKLYDNALVAPGVLVRQNYSRRLIGYTKVSATKVLVQGIQLALQVEAIHTDIVSALRKDAASMLDADVVINATASSRVAAALEKHFRDVDIARPPIASLVLGHDARSALMTYAVPKARGVTVDLDRRMKLALAGAAGDRTILNEFWPIEGRASNRFQPEPGCSDPTFVGSAADVYGLSASMLNVLSRWVRNPNSTERRGYSLIAPGTLPKPKFSAEQEFSWPEDIVFPDHRQGFEIRMTGAARNVLLGWIRSARRRLGATVETGGLLFGQIDEFLRVIWVDEVSGPPLDSQASPAGFVCGTEGTAQLNAEKSKRTRGSVRFVGMWHTHPCGRPLPSCTDLRAMAKLWNLPDFTARQFLMLIAGGGAGWHHMAGYLFARRRRGKR